MTYRSLLVLLDQDPLCAERTRMAIQLSKAFESHLFGWAPTGLVDLPGSPAAAASLADFAAAAWDALTLEAERAVAQFRTACASGGLNDFDAEVHEGDAAGGLMRHVHGHDLIVLTQGDSTNAQRPGVSQLVEQAVLYSARPALILPYAGRFDARFDNVMVAWDDSREAARAIADALPLLKRAQRVHVVAWSEKPGHAPTDPHRLQQLARWLERHGISAQLHMESTQVQIADAMLSRACDLEVELIVMGAYGHSRWTERVLGGATQGLLRSMTVPVLMSH